MESELTLAQDTLHIGNLPFDVQLKKTELTWKPENEEEGQVSTLLTKEILSVELQVRSEQHDKGGKTLGIFNRKKQVPFAGILQISFAKKKSAESAEWRIRKLKLSHADYPTLEKWFAQLQSILRDFRHRPKNILVFVNPYGGSRDAPKIFESQVKPVLETAHVSWTLIQTERRNHVTDTLLSLSAGELSTYDVTVAVGGDGTAGEVVTGLLKLGQKDAIREEEEKQKQKENGCLNHSASRSSLTPPKFRPSPMPIAVISAGSTNSLAYTLHGTEDGITGAIHLVLGKSVPLDVASIETVSSSSSSSSNHGKNLNSSDNDNGDNNCRLIVGQLSYGHLADTLRYSEKLRWMGPKRYDYAGFKKFLEHNSYRGKVHMKLAEEISSEPSVCGGGSHCDVCQTSNSNSNDTNSTSSELSEKWDIYEGHFLGISGANMSCRCTISPLGLAPFAHLSDGCLDLMLIKRASHLDHLKYLFRLAGDSRRVMNLPFVERFRVREFKFEPLSCSCSTSWSGNGEDNELKQRIKQKEEDCPNGECSCDMQSRLKRQSGWNCDGELLTSPSIHVKVHQKLIRIMTKTDK